MPGPLGHPRIPGERFDTRNLRETFHEKGRILLPLGHVIGETRQLTQKQGRLKLSESQVGTYKKMLIPLASLRSTTVGVGSCGIGQDLMEYIRKFYYSDISALLVLIVSLVVIIDVLTGRLRHFLLGLQEAR